MNNTMIKAMVMDLSTNSFKAGLKAIETSTLEASLVNFGIKVINEVFGTSVEAISYDTKVENFETAYVAALTKSNLNITKVNTEAIPNFQKLFDEFVNEFTVEENLGIVDINKQAILVVIQSAFNRISETISKNLKVVAAQPVQEQPAQTTQSQPSQEAPQNVQSQPVQEQPAQNIFPKEEQSIPEIKVETEKSVPLIDLSQFIRPANNVTEEVTIQPENAKAVHNQQASMELLTNNIARQYCIVPRRDWEDKIKNVKVFEDNILKIVNEIKKLYDKQYLLSITDFKDENNFTLTRLVERGKNIKVSESNDPDYIQVSFTNGVISVAHNGFKDFTNVESVPMDDGDKQLQVLRNLFTNFDSAIKCKEDIIASIVLGNKLFELNKANQQYTLFMNEGGENGGKEFFAIGEGFGLAFNNVTKDIMQLNEQMISQVLDIFSNNQQQ